MAFFRVYPKLQIKFSNSIAMGVYGRPTERHAFPRDGPEGHRGNAAL
ncbi:MAG: hypothetical protein MZU97_03775 [Bacillus subtilis]|nr:hypothetical protein [Bacillus subtilis]